MRAPLTQSLLATIESLDPLLRGRVLGGIRRGAVDEVRSALPITWVPFPVHMEIVGALSRVVGEEEFVHVWRRTMVGAFGRPFLRSFVAMSKTIFEFKPAGLFSKASHIYHHVTRGLGSLTFAPETAETGIAHLWGFPSGFAFRTYAEGMCGCFLAALDILDHPGTSELAEVNERIGSAKYRIAWK